MKHAEPQSTEINPDLIPNGSRVSAALFSRDLQRPSFTEADVHDPKLLP